MARETRRFRKQPSSSNICTSTIRALRGFFRRIAYLAPGKEIRTLLDSAPSWFARSRSTALTARVAYTDPEKKPFKGTMTHDLEIYRELAYVKGD